MSRSQLTSTVEQNTGGAVSPYAAGKNKIINGDFGIWQRGTSLSYTTNAGAYLADRFLLNFAGTFTGTISQQTFTPGTAPVAGYEGQFFNRIVRTGTTSVAPTFYQRIENVRTFAGQTVTFSFWAKADAARSITIQAYQSFGTGGSGATDNNAGTASLTTSWQRFSFTYTMPSVAGKTISTSNDSWMTFYWNLPDSTAFTIDTWGWQLEAGSVATPFTTATGTLSGELAACQRYGISLGGNVAPIGVGQSTATTFGVYTIALPVTMRTTPSITTSSASTFLMTTGTDSSIVCSATPTFNIGSPTVIRVIGTVASGLTAGQGSILLGNVGAGTIFLSAEL